MSRSAVAAVVIALAAALMPSPPALADPARAAGGADWVVASGTCDAGGRWAIAARAARRGVLVRVRVIGGRGRWQVRLTHNGRPVRIRGRFAVTRNEPGVDQYGLTARNRRTGQICVGALSY